MSEIATASINSFGSTSPNADFVPPSEEPVFILTSSQLKNLITQAVEQAVQEAASPLVERIEALEDRAARQDEKIAALESTADTQADNQLIQLRLINDLREATKKEAQPMQRDRGEILRALLAVNGGKLLAKEARQKMYLTKPLFSMLIASMKDDIEIKPLHSDKRKKVLALK